MRLTKPTLMPFHPLISDQRDLTSTLSEELTQSDIARPDDLSYFGVSDLLTLPQNFGYVDEELVRELTQELLKIQYSVNFSREGSGRVHDSRPRGSGFEPHRYHCIVSLSKNINPSLVLVQPRKTHPFITERLLMGHKA